MPSAPQSLADAVRAVRADGRKRDIRCPAHEDSTPSLSVSLSDREYGVVLVHCHAGCPPTAVVTAGGLTFADLSPPNGNGSHPPDLDITYDYVDEQGHLLFQVVRKPGKVFRQRRPDPDRPGDWLWSLGDTRRVLYRLPEVVAAVKARTPVWIVEGEKDVHTCEAHGLVATCNPGGASKADQATKWRPEYSKALAGAHIVIVRDKDEAGTAHADAIVRSLTSTGVASWRIVEAADGKDATDHFDAGHSVEDFVHVRGSKPKLVAPEPEGDFNPADLREGWNADRFVARHGENVRYVRELNEWFLWDGQRFKKDRVGAVSLLARETLMSLVDETDPDFLRKVLYKHLARHDTASGHQNILRIAGARPGIALVAEDFDRDPYLLSVSNGTLDLRTGALRPHQQRDNLSRVVGHPIRGPVSYHPEALCPTWEEYLWQILGERADLMRFVQKAVGYSLTGDGSEECLFMLYGSGANGKSVFLRVLGWLLGDYAATANYATIMEAGPKDGGEHRADIVALIGTRFVTVSEVPEDKRLNEALIKAATGRDRQTARAAYGRTQLVFESSYKLWIALNHLPVIRDTSEGMWRRLRVIPFDVTIPREARDRTLDEKLWLERDGILRWAVQGCLAWQREGLGEPVEVRAATETYRERSDDLATFVDEACIVAPNARIGSSMLHRHYKKWAEDAGLRPIAEKSFRAALEAYSVRRDPTANSGRGPFVYTRTTRERAWIGLSARKLDAPGAAEERIFEEPV